MSRNSSGVYSKPAGTTPTNGDDADATQFNLLMDDMTQALTDSMPRDGSAPMTGPLAMGSNKITGLATGTDADDAVRFDQISGLAPKLVPAGLLYTPLKFLGICYSPNMGYHSRLTTGARLVTITDIAIGIFAGNMLTAVFLMGVREAKKHSDEREIPYGHLLMMLGPLGLTALAYLAKGSLS